MKLVSAIMLVFSLHVTAKSTSQTITLSGKNIPLQKVFSEIKRQSGYLVVYNKEMISNLDPVSLDASNEQLLPFLDRLLHAQSLDYIIENLSIILKVMTTPPTEGLNPLLSFPLPPIRGRIEDSAGNPLQGATVAVKGSKNLGVTNAEGIFTINAAAGDILLISFMGYRSTEYKISSAIVAFSDQQGKTGTGVSFTISLKPSVVKLEEVEVAVNTGYQKISKERSTGSFVSIDRELLNRRVSATVLDRLEGIASGIAFNSNDEYGSKEISVRGRSTLFANSNPLIVVDNFPYEGSINNINPNDILSVTILRDAAAASIWGVRAGNGVIVITTKKGSLGKKTTVEINANTGWEDKPDLFYVPRMTSAELIGVETDLFNRGFYDDKIADLYGQHQPLSPAVEILAKQRDGSLTPDQAAAQLNTLKNSDKRNDRARFIYHNPVRQQYAVNISGGSERAAYYLSAGFDNALSSLRDKQSRYTINSQNTLEIVKGFQVSAGINYIRNNNALGKYTLSGSIYPYERLTDDQGNGLPQTDLFRNNFTEQLPSKGFLNWENNPVKDALLNNSSTQTEDIRLSLVADYKITKTFSASLNYQYQQQGIEGTDLHDANSYFTRNLINSYSQIDFPAGNVLSRPIPTGAILDKNNNNIRSVNLRGQVNYSQSIGEHEITAIAGAEQREVHSTLAAYRLYGYNDQTLTSTSVDYVTAYTTYPQYFQSNIPSSPELQRDITDRYRSWFANAAYTFKGRYTVTGSARKDASNYFGVSTNQRAVPLWSAGIKWDISKEFFYKIDALPVLVLRATYGYNGNINKSLTAFTTMQYSGNNLFNLPAARIINPPNSKLRWEKTGMTNIALDFQLKNQRITGSIDWFIKKGIDLTGYSAIDGTTGISLDGIFFGNVANMRGGGIDLQLTTNNLIGKFGWQSNFLLSRASDRVTHYNFQPQSYYLLANYGISPLQGKPVYGIYSYAWAGLDPLTGDPQGYLNKTISKDYSQLTNPAVEELVYHGTARPLWFGSIRNTFSYKRMELSANIIYKLDYYFRRKTINYSSLVYSYDTHSDYNLRWQKPGDELTTNVPSMTDAVDFSRESFNNFASPWVEKGDHIRLQDIRLSYTPSSSIAGKLFLQDIQVFIYANNLGLLWKKNDAGIDPDYQYVPPVPINISIGLTARFK